MNYRELPLAFDSVLEIFTFPMGGLDNVPITCRDIHRLPLRRNELHSVFKLWDSSGSGDDGDPHPAQTCTFQFLSPLD
jgi:hypothetical protein